jgi:hypothetical protein
MWNIYLCGNPKISVIKLQKTPCFGPNMKIPLDKSNEFGPQGMKNIKPMTKEIFEENYFCTLGYSGA